MLTLPHARVTRCGVYFNVKSSVSGIRLNDPGRNTISDEKDPRLQFLLDNAASFSEMDPRILPENMRMKMLLTDTSEALVTDITRYCFAGKNFAAQGFSYVMLGGADPK